MVDETKKILNYLVEKLDDLKSFKGLVLFGSYAKETQNKKSDFDIIISFEKLPHSIIKRDELINDIVLDCENKFKIEINPILADDNSITKTQLTIEIADYAKIIVDKNNTFQKLFDSIKKDYQKGYIKKIQKDNYLVIEVK